MIAVVLDTNAVHSDSWLTSEPGKKLLALAERGSCIVIYPQVVIDELCRQRREAAEHAHAQAAKGVSDMAKAGVDVARTAADLKASFRKIDADLDAAFGSVIARDGVTSEPVPNVAVAEILKRDLARKRPFMEVQVKQKPASVGFRDTLIWETVLAVMEPSRGYEKVLFVTADKGFLTEDSKSLHLDLLDDLDERYSDRDCVVSVKNIPHAIAEVESAAQAALVTLATNALYELVGKEISLQMVYGGDYDYPDFVNFTTPAVESGCISDIDQTSEFELADADDTVTVTADALIYIEGTVFKGDWYMDDTETVQILGELNDHYFETSTEVAVRVVVEIDKSETSPQVVSIVLEDQPSGPDASAPDELAVA